MGDAAARPTEHGIFGTFAHVFSFGNLERAVRRALGQGRHKEAVDRVLVGSSIQSAVWWNDLGEGGAKPGPRLRDTSLPIQLLEVLRKRSPSSMPENVRDSASPPPLAPSLSR